MIVQESVAVSVEVDAAQGQISESDVAGWEDEVAVSTSSADRVTITFNETFAPLPDRGVVITVSILADNYTHAEQKVNELANSYPDIYAWQALFGYAIIKIGESTIDRSETAVPPTRVLLGMFYAATFGEGWTDSTNWKSGFEADHACNSASVFGPADNWLGLLCYGGWREEPALHKVLSIRLPNNKLSGTLPTELGLLPDITTLKLSSNMISGTIPSELAQLTRLADRLYLDHNRLSGTIPSEFGLMEVDSLPALQGNLLSGYIPSEFGLIGKLAFPALSYNSLSGTVPEQWRVIQTADALFDLASNPLSGSLSVQVPSLDEWRRVVDRTVQADATGKKVGHANWWDRHVLPDDRMSPWGRLEDGGATCESSGDDVLAGGRGSPWPIAKCG